MTIKEFLFGNSKKYGTLSYKVSYFFKYKLPFSKKWNKFHNPLYHWWKVRKYFKRPKCHKQIFGKIGWFYGLPYRNDYYNRFVDIRFSALGWKDKYNSPRHEWDPYIAITLFRKWQICWVFNWISPKDGHSGTRNMATWEAILDYIYYDFTLKEVVNNNVWSSCFKKQGEKEITIVENLTSLGKQVIHKSTDDIKYKE